MNWMRRNFCYTALFGLAVALSGCSQPATTPNETTPTLEAPTPTDSTTGTTDSSTGAGSAEGTQGTEGKEGTESTEAKEGENAQADKGTVEVVMETSKGTITLALNREKAPVSVDNFVSYAKSGHFNGTIFHRVIPGFMIQGGGFTPDMKEKETKDPIKNEAANGLRNERGTIAMARTSDPNSATAQFFINLVHNDFLDYPGQDGYGYAVFGKVTKGMDVLDKIAQVPTGTKPDPTGLPHENVPTEPVLIKSVKVR